MADPLDRFGWQPGDVKVFASVTDLGFHLGTVVGAALFEDARGNQFQWVKDFIVWCAGQADEPARDIGHALASRDYSVEPPAAMVAKWQASIH